MFTTIEIATAANDYYSRMESARKIYNSLVESGRLNEMGIGGRTLGDYAMAEYKQMESLFNYWTSKLN